MKRKNLTSLSHFIDEKAGPKGSKNRDKYNRGAFRLGVLIQQARQKKGLTQEQPVSLREQISPTFPNWKRI